MKRPKLDGIIFTKQQAPGAILNGSLAEKCNSLPDDKHQDGARATVVGSLGPYKVGGGIDHPYMYFVVWEDDRRGLPVAISGSRLRSLVKPS